MWRSGEAEFTSSKISRLEHHLIDGGSVWIRSDRNDSRISAVVVQGEKEHPRTHKNGSVLSVRTTGEGDMEMMSRITLDKAVYVSRNDSAHDDFLTVTAYKFIRKTWDVAAAETPGPNIVLQSVIDVAKVSSWLGVICFYVTQIPGPMFVKLPGFLLVIALVSRTVGLGVFYPVIAIIRAVWIVVRLCVDFATDTNSNVDVWFLAFILSLSWPACKGGWLFWNWLFRKAASDEDDQSRASSRRLPAAPSQRSHATTRTASDTMSSAKTADRDQDEEECHADGVLLSHEPDRKLSATPCKLGNAVWRRLSDKDGRVERRGKTNRFDSCDWIRLCADHGAEYEEWRLSQTCTVNVCQNERSIGASTDEATNVRPHHFTGKKAVEERGTEGESGGEENGRQRGVSHESRTPTSGCSALDRVMKLQKRTISKRRGTERNERKETDHVETQSNSRGSEASRGSSSHMNESNRNTVLPPEQPVVETKTTGENDVPLRRRSTGGMENPVPEDMLPFELVKRPIKQLNVPLVSQQLDLPVLASSETELIVNRLESIEERKDPERQWAKVNKYTAYALRGFGMFCPEVGRGVYGLELQKALRRQADGLKHSLWNLKIRVPLTNRITAGIALVSWGAEDGKTGTKESIMLGDCYPLDTRSFDHFRLSGDKLEDHGKQPTTAHMFTKMARQQPRLFSAAYGEEHLTGRLNAIDRANDIHEECPEFFHRGLLK